MTTHYVELQLQQIKDKLSNVDAKTSLILKYLNIFYEKENKMSFDLKDLVTAVEAERTQEASIMALVHGLAQKLASVTPNVVDESTRATLASIVNELNLNTSAMAAAVSANAPAQEPVATNTNSQPAADVPTNSTDATTVNPPAEQTVTTTQTGDNSVNTTPVVNATPVSNS